MVQKYEFFGGMLVQIERVFEAVRWKNWLKFGLCVRL